jgi:hypothetical protein
MSDSQPPNLGSEMPDSSILIAAGNTAIGLGHAIKGLIDARAVTEALELSKTLAYISKNISWMLKLEADRIEDQTRAQSAVSGQIRPSSQELHPRIRPTFGKSARKIAADSGKRVVANASTTDLNPEGV